VQGSISITYDLQKCRTSRAGETDQKYCQKPASCLLIRRREEAAQCSHLYSNRKEQSNWNQMLWRLRLRNPDQSGANGGEICSTALLRGSSNYESKSGHLLVVLNRTLLIGCNRVPQNFRVRGCHPRYFYWSTRPSSPGLLAKVSVLEYMFYTGSSKAFYLHLIWQDDLVCVARFIADCIDCFQSGGNPS
jgi:hypothetical protein